MRWQTQTIEADTPGVLPGLARLANLIRSVRTPEFEGMTFHEVAAKSALNRVSEASRMPFRWTINPYRGCSHACAYCFARSTHTYLGFGAGRDFEREVVVKVNIADVLAAELARPSWSREPVALGTNTDPYQRAEGRYRLMPGVLGALARSGTPFSIVTKGTLLRRDIPLLAALARDVDVSVAVTVSVGDEALQRSLEPGTPSASARLATVAEAAEAGLRPSVFISPVIPYLTDTEEHLDDLLGRAAAAGASSVYYEILHLRPGAKEVFADWMRHHRPELLASYRELYGRGAYVPDEYREEATARVRAAIDAHGLGRGPFRTSEVEATAEKGETPTLFAWP